MAFENCLLVFLKTGKPSKMDYLRFSTFHGISVKHRSLIVFSFIVVGFVEHPCHL